MNPRQSFEEIAAFVCSLSKAQVKDRLLHYAGRPRLDFTENYLDRLSVDRLRHILLAAMVTGSQN